MENALKNKAPRVKRVAKASGKALLWSVLVVMAVLVGLVLGLDRMLGQLDSPMVKTSICRAVRAQTGISLAYDVLKLSPFSGLRLGGLQVATPGPFARHAPRMLGLKDLEVGWSFWGLLAGDLELEKLRIEGLALNLVADHKGQTSLDALSPESKEPSGTPGGDPGPEEKDKKFTLSQLLVQTLPDMSIQNVSLSGLDLEFVQLDDAGVARRITLIGPQFGASLEAHKGSLAVYFQLEPEQGSQGTSLVVEDRPGTPQAKKREALIDLRAKVSTPGPGAVALEITASAVKQDMFKNLPRQGELARLKAGVTFEPQKRRTRVHVTDLYLLQGAAQVDLEGELGDLQNGAGFGLLAQKVRMSLDASQVLDKLGLEVPGLSLAQTAIQVEADQVVLDSASGMPTQGKFKVRGQLGKVELEQGSARAELSGVTLALDGRVDEDGQMLISSEVVGKVLHAAMSGPDSQSSQVTSRDLKIAVRAKDLSIDSDQPMSSKGDIQIEGDLGSLTAQQGERKFELNRLSLGVSSGLRGGPPFAVNARIPVGKISVEAPRLGRASLDDMLFTLSAKDVHPDFEKPAQAHLEFGFGKSRLRGPGRRVDAQQLQVIMDAQVTSPEKLSAQIKIPARKLDARLGRALAIGVRNLDLGLDLKDVLLPADAPAEASAKIVMRTRLGGLTTRSGDMRISGRKLGLDADVELSKGRPVSLKSKIPLQFLKVVQGNKGKRLASLSDGWLDLRVDGIALNKRDPLSSRARVKLKGKMGQVGLEAGTQFGMPSLSIKLDAGGRSRLGAGLVVALDPVKVEGRALGARVELDLEAKANLNKPGAELALLLKGRGSPHVKMDGRAEFARRDRKVTWALTTQASRLGLLKRFLPADLKKSLGLAWPKLGVSLDTRGALTGVVKSFAGFKPVLEPQLVESFAGDFQLNLGLTGLALAQDKLSLASPEIGLRVDGRRTAGQLSAELDLRSDRVALDMGRDKLELSGFTHKVMVQGKGQPRTGRVSFQSSTGIKNLGQSFVAGYPVADASLFVEASMDRMASVRLDKFELNNPAGGTRLKLNAAVDRLQDLVGDLPAGRLAGRQAFGLSGSLDQDLGKLTLLGPGCSSSGQLSIPFQVESGDLKAYRLIGRLDAYKINLNIPQSGISLVDFSGRIPILEDFARGADNSIRLVAGPPGNLYKRARFMDVHPFLRGNNFLTIERLGLLGQELGPLAGNMHISWGILAIDQLQLAFKGGKIAGQLAADYNGGKPKLYFKGNGTGIKPSQSEDVLDANATLDLSTEPLALSGRIQIVRIGQQHLLDVLDWLDPYKENVGVNRARLGLKVGYPKFLRLLMRDGFLSAKLELGGAAQVVRIDEIRGIALGPLLGRYVAPILGR